MSGTSWSFVEAFRVPEVRLPRWDSFLTFRAPTAPIPGWASGEELARADALLRQRDLRLLTAELAAWSARLAHCGGDPSANDWLRFRPLRTEREEDWSDWLQYLLVTSRSGALAAALLGESWRGARLTARREVVAGDRRADLVVAGAAGERAQIEVKVGDRAFAKTVETAVLLESHEPAVWTHVLLVPATDRSAARGETGGENGRITIRTWDDVAVALRGSLWRADEALEWSVWARAFCGAIEQRLIGLPYVHEAAEPATANMLFAHLSQARRLVGEEHE